MITPVPMCRVTLALLTEDLVQAGLVLGRFGCFAPQPEAREKALPEVPLADYRERFEQARTRLLKICRFLEVPPEADTIPERAPTLEALQQLDAWLEEIWNHCSCCEENLRRNQEALREVRQLQKLLHSYRQLDVDLGLLQRDLRFLQVRLGTVPRQNLGRLREAVALAGFSLTRFANLEDRAQVGVAGLKRKAEQLETVLRAADFRELTLPEAFSDHPAQVEASLRERERRLHRERQHLEQEIRERREQHGERLREVAGQLTAASGFAGFGDAPSSRGGLARVAGWIPAAELENLRHALDQALSNPVFLEARPPRREEYSQVPSNLRHGSWLQPFAALVRTYGIPRYRELDPTWFLAVSFSIMFGMMFGDLGHGLLIALGGWLLGYRLPLARPLLVAAGISSMLFGLLYGSLFGYEGLIPALWLSPLEDPVRMLKVAFAWGVFFILLATLFRIRNDLAEGDWQSALFDGHGLAGLTLYLALLAAGWQWSSGGSLTRWHLASLALPLAAILIWKWRRLEAPLGERLLVVAIEGFETFMNYVSNTLSFLRVAAFGLNHVALALAVFALAGMMQTTGHWITVILGNLFIVLMEGAIVVIQVLRLEYYEGFSRFFRGDGRPFQPLRLTLDGGRP